MRKLLLAVGLLFFCMPVFAGSKLVPARENPIPDQYMVLLQPGGMAVQVDQVAADLAAHHGGKVLQVWSHALRGFSVRLSEAAARSLAQDPRVALVEQDSRFTLSAVADCRFTVPTSQVQERFPAISTGKQAIDCVDPYASCVDNWGLDRIDQPNPRDTGNPSYKSEYLFPLTGAGVHVYVIDAGIEANHQEFRTADGLGTRIKDGINYSGVGGSDDLSDSFSHGHGTHVSALIAGRTYGVAKDAYIHPVKVTSTDGDTSHLISGLNWVAQHRILPAVANLSGANVLGWNRDVILQQAVRGMMAAHVALIQAAGNQEKDACAWSLGNPYSVPETVIVGGTNASDGRYREIPPQNGDAGSNTGRCVDLWAPAEAVISASKQPFRVPGDDDPYYDGYCRLSGTSMAAPHATGVAALLLQRYDKPDPPSGSVTHVPAAAVGTALRAAAVGGKLQTGFPAGIGGDSPNLFLQTQLPTDGPPVPGDDWFREAGAPIYIAYTDLLNNDFDWGPRPMAVTSVQTPAHGTLTFDANGFTYDPGSYIGNESFSYQVNNSAGLASFGTITILDTRPVVVDDHLTFIDGTSVTFSTDQLVQNDFDPEGSTNGQSGVSFVTFVGNPASGNLAFQGGTSWKYFPWVPYPGSDSVRYRIADADGHTSEGRLFFSTYAGGTGGDPQAVLDTATTLEGARVTIDVDANDQVAPQGALDVIGFTVPSHGTVSFGVDEDVLIYTPDNVYAGFDSFTYRVRSQGQIVSGGSVSVEILPQLAGPIARPDFFTTERDTELAIGYTGLLANDSGTNLTFRTDLFTDPPHGALSFCCNAGAFRYNPDPSYVGADSFYYVIEDGSGHQSSAPVSINVVFLNHAPIPNPDSVVTEHDTAITIPVLANDTDQDGDLLTVTAVTQPASGTVTINGGTTVTYTPPLGFTGTVTFTYTVQDSHATTATGNVTVRVRAQNIPPDAVNDAFSSPRNAVFSFTCAQLLANDTDADAEPALDGPLTVIAIGPASPASAGTLTCNACSCTLTPTFGFTGPINVPYTIDDHRPGGTDSAAAQVTVFNRVPVAVNDVTGTPPNTAKTYDVRVNDSDPDGDPLTVNGFTQPAAGTGTCAIATGGTGVIYTPPAGFMTSASCTYTVTDGLATSAPATVTFYINRAPIARGDQIRVPFATQVQIARATLLGNDFDPDGDALTISSFDTTGMNGSLSCPVGGTSCTYTPPGGYYTAVTSFKYTATDGRTGFSTATVKLKVGVVQSLPVANDDLLLSSLNTAKAFTVLDVLANDTDAEGDVLSAGIISGPRDYGSVSCSTPAYNCTYTPNTGFVGIDRFSYTATDGADGSSTAFLKMLVLPPSPAAFDAREDQLSTTQNTARFFTRGFLTSNDYSPTNDPLTVASFDTAGLNGTLDCVTDTFGCTYTPPSFFAGTTRFKYTVSDTHGHSDTAIVRIKVGGSNAAPVAVNDSLTTRANTPLTFSIFDLLRNDTDAENDPLAVTVYPYPSHGTVSCSTPSYWCTYTPTAGYTGTDSFTYVVSDGIAASTQATVTVNVQPVLAKDALITSQSVPGSMVAGQVYPVTMKIKNIGTVAWSTIGPVCNAFRLGSANPQDNTTWGPSRVELPSTVAPGAEVTLNFNVTAPAAPGPYNFQRRMVHECVEWFGDLSPNVVVSVRP